MKKLLSIVVLGYFVCCSLFAEVHLIPLAGCKYLQTAEDDYLLSPSAGIQIMNIVPDSGALSASVNYSLDYYNRGFGDEKIKKLHGINLMGSYSWDKNGVTVMLNSKGEVPFSDVKTLTGIALYTRQIVKTDSFSFVFGGGIAAGDLGKSVKDVNLYALPFPVFSLGYHNDIVSTSLSFMGTPGFNLVLFPEAIVRFDGTVALAGFDSAKDLTFDCALKAYPFKNTAAGEVISFAAGVSNTIETYKLANKDEYGFQYYSAYGELNATFLTLRCGYNFNGSKIFNKEVKGDMYNGIFASVSAMFFF